MMKNKKSKWDSVKLEDFKEKLSYTRFKDGRIVPDKHECYRLPRKKYVYMPGKGYIVKTTRGGW